MWLNFVFLILASLCVGFILGWLVARPRRWGVFVSDIPANGEEQAGVDSLTHGG
jgi:hypothetical protein